MNWLVFWASTSHSQWESYGWQHHDQIQLIQNSEAHLSVVCIHAVTNHSKRDVFEDLPALVARANRKTFRRQVAADYREADW